MEHDLVADMIKALRGRFPGKFGEDHPRLVETAAGEQHVLF
jgi:hypothetical protein